MGCVNLDLNPNSPTVYANRNTPGTNTAFTGDDIRTELYVDFPSPTMTTFSCHINLYNAYKSPAFNSYSLIGWNFNNYGTPFYETTLAGGDTNVECFC